MLKIKLLSCFLFLIQFSAFSQVKSVLIDEKTGKPVPYASVYVKNSERGTSTELDGSFSLEIGKYDTLIISSIGYNKVEFSYPSLKDTLFMENDIKQMGELTVTSERSLKLFPNRNVIGEVKSSFFADNFWLGTGGNPYRIARYFEYKFKYEDTRFLESIMLETLSDLNGAKFSINFFTIGSDGMPDEPMLKKFIVSDTKKNRNKVKIHLLDHNIFFPKEGLFLVIKFLNIDQNRSLRDTPLEFGGEEYKYKYSPSFSLIKTESPQLYTYNSKAQKWALSESNLRIIEAELVLIE